MSHKVHPYAHRIGTLRDWKSRWFARGKDYRKFLKSDLLLREYLEKKLRGFFVDSIEMERGRANLRISIKTSRPGMIIGRSGEGSAKLKNATVAFLRKIGGDIPKDIKLDILEVRSPESRAAIVAYMIAEGLEKRMPYRRVLKQVVEKVMANKDVKGTKVFVTGRLGGADIARSEYLKKGRLPLQTFRADVDFARERARLPYGDIGIKVWIYRGEVFAEKQGAKKK